MSAEPKQIVMLASENNALINGKIGGLADVICDLPDALADFGFKITVITPAYGFLHKTNPSKLLTKILFPFCGKTFEGEIWQVIAKNPKENVTHLVFEHPAIRGTPIYSIDPLDQPFAQDATKFALFTSAIGQFLKSLDSSSIIHLHDWHTPTLLLLKELHPQFEHLRKHKFVFTIHNLAYQGNRPMCGKHSTVEEWFPELFNETSWIQYWKDTRYKEPQFTPLAAGIKYADKVNTVSPTYAEEILIPSDHTKGFYGGEGLDPLLIKANSEHRLYGILNGINYPSQIESHRLSFTDLTDLIIQEVENENRENPDRHSDHLLLRLRKIRTRKPKILLTSITRVTEQKVRLLFETGPDGKSSIDKILEDLEREDGFYFFLGNGTRELEKKCERTFKRHERFIYIKLFSNPISQTLYANGSIFMMPSSFEPCGISQMIAMRHGQPCIVHAVGGLKDTVIDGVNGFQFSGSTIKEQVDDFVSVTKKAINIYLNDKPQWEKIKSAAANARFDWKESAEKYIRYLYKKKD